VPADTRGNVEWIEGDSEKASPTGDSGNLKLLKLSMVELGSWRGSTWTWSNQVVGWNLDRVEVPCTLRETEEGE
jgi:hypothetical protein